MKWLMVICKSNDALLERQKNQYKVVKELCISHSIKVACLLYDCNRKEIVVAEAVCKDIIDRCRQEEYSGIIVAENESMKELAGLIAAKLQWECLTGITKIVWKQEYPVLYKLAYNYNMEAGFAACESFVAGLARWKRQEICETLEEIIQAVPNTGKMPSCIINRKLKEAKVQEEGSKILIAAGKGVRSKGDIEMLRRYASQRGFSFGVSRPVAMNGWAGIDEIIGVSGKIYAPEICVTFGVSGSAAFYAGIENSKWIASINIDKKAPIIGMSDVSLIDDYATVWDSIMQLL